MHPACLTRYVSVAQRACVNDCECANIKVQSRRNSSDSPQGSLINLNHTPRQVLTRLCALGDCESSFSCAWLWIQPHDSYRFATSMRALDLTFASSFSPQNMRAFKSTPAAPAIALDPPSSSDSFHSFARPRNHAKGGRTYVLQWLRNHDFVDFPSLARLYSGTHAGCAQLPCWLLLPAEGKVR